MHKILANIDESLSDWTHGGTISSDKAQLSLGLAPITPLPNLT